MEFVSENSKLLLKNIIRYRALILNNDIDTIISKMSDYVSSFGAKTMRVLTITQGLNFETGIQRLDMEFMVEANQPIKGIAGAFMTYQAVKLNEYNRDGSGVYLDYIWTQIPTVITCPALAPFVCSIKDRG